MSYEFAQNKLKIANSIAAIKARGETVSDESVYKEYVKRGGKIVDVAVKHVEPKKLEDSVQVIKNPEVSVLEKPRRGRKIAI